MLSLVELLPQCDHDVWVVDKERLYSTASRGVVHGVDLLVLESRKDTFVIETDRR